MRLGKWHRRLVLATLVVVGVSGILWFVLHDLMDREADALLHTLLMAHGITAYASAIAFGSILPLHAVAGYRQRRNLASGVVASVALVLLIGSALLLYYGSEETHAWARWVHIVAGFGGIVAAPLHIVLGRRLRKQSYSARLKGMAMDRARSFSSAS